MAQKIASLKSSPNWKSRQLDLELSDPWWDIFGPVFWTINGNYSWRYCCVEWSIIFWWCTKGNFSRLLTCKWRNYRFILQEIVIHKNPNQFIIFFTAFVDLGNDDRMYSPVGTKDNGIDYNGGRNAYHYPTSPQQFQMDERK